MLACAFASLLQAVVAELVMIPAVDGGLAAMMADDGVAARTTTSRLRAAVAERVMATVAGSGVAATTTTSAFRPRLRSGRWPQVLMVVWRL